MFYKLIWIVAVIYLYGCSEVTTEPVEGVAGSAGKQVPVYRDTQGNVYGYYEYLPLAFSEDLKTKQPLLFYWNGANAISGNGGKNELSRLLNQGLPENINKGDHYPLIIISAMLEDWKKDNPHDFVEYILHRYKNHIDFERIYMSGFSAGGGVTIRYTSENPERLAAIVPIAAATKPLANGDPSENMAAVPSWMFHNKGDTVVSVKNSTIWHEALVRKGGEHLITLNDSDSHYAWQSTYANQTMWSWLLSKRKNRK